MCSLIWMFFHWCFAINSWLETKQIIKLMTNGSSHVFRINSTIQKCVSGSVQLSYYAECMWTLPFDEWTTKCSLAPGLLCRIHNLGTVCRSFLQFFADVHLCFATFHQCVRGIDGATRDIQRSVCKCILHQRQMSQMCNFLTDVSDVQLKQNSVKKVSPHFVPFLIDKSAVLCHCPWWLLAIWTPPPRQPIKANKVNQLLLLRSETSSSDRNYA